MFILILSGENRVLAQREADPHNTSFIEGNLLLIDQLQEHLGLTKAAFQVIWSGQLPDFRLTTPLTGSFAVRSHTAQSEKELASLVWQEQERYQQPTVDLANPDNTIAFFTINGKDYAARLVWSNSSFEARKAHNRVHNHPTSLHPKLARAMINLAQGNAILDPFCGSGGILLEGCLIGKQMTGTDIDPLQLKRSEENLAAFQQEAMLSLLDANHCDSLGEFDAIVTDLPLGRNAKLTAFSDFFSASKKTAKRMVIGIDKDIDISPWKLKEEFSWYIHKSMTKRILLLE